MRFELFIASRYLRAKRRQAVIGVITAISIVGVTAGVASLIIALAINNGFRQDLQQRLLGATAHVSLLRTAADGIHDWRPLVDKLAQHPEVRAAAPAIYEEVLVSRGGRAKGVFLKGVLPEYERRISDLFGKVTFGTVGALEQEDPDPPPVLLGDELAKHLNATVGSVVVVTIPQGELTPFGIVPKYVRFKVAGIFDSGFYEYDNGFAYARLEDVQRLAGLADVVSIIEFKLQDLNRAAEVGQQLKQQAGAGFDTTNWMEQNAALFRALRLERVVTFITIGLIVLVAALNILISLIMMVMEKTRDIAILMSLGTRRRQVRNIFVAQGALIGVIGTALGLVVGYAISWAAGAHKWITLSAEVYAIDYVPFAPRLMDGLIVAAVSLGISLIATLYPSWSASRILPAEALRYE